MNEHMETNCCMFLLLPGNGLHGCIIQDLFIFQTICACILRQISNDSVSLDETEMLVHRSVSSSLMTVALSAIC